MFYYILYFIIIQNICNKLTIMEFSKYCITNTLTTSTCIVHLISLSDNILFYSFKFVLEIGSQFIHSLCVISCISSINFSLPKQGRSHRWGRGAAAPHDRLLTRETFYKILAKWQFLHNEKITKTKSKKY